MVKMDHSRAFQEQEEIKEYERGAYVHEDTLSLSQAKLTRGVSVT
jgi:hypothetical protein